ncbi:acyl-CoA thioesterase YbgC [Pigmentiphaga humi]|uniref:Acyl-CoA thioesterase YbgC n=1 Tax=Pigmentiphaga humi TaxID=2478468 RepID=A0A3P4B518_9BURK|nr:acyl-CoA thioesterase [Pigmentiphaga humi]VCU71373.1 acyl-CoA thioesterase YbgC [Pigmentiphaga humi]
MRKRGLLGIDIPIKVPFYDIDSLNVVWHGHYVKYFEEVRCELLDDIGYNYDDMLRDGYVWPVVDLQLRYVKPATFRQALDVRAELVEWENRLRINYLVSCAASGARLTRGTTTQIAVSVATREMLYTSPPSLVQAVEAALTRRGFR